VTLTVGRQTGRETIVGSSKDFGISFRVRMGLLHVFFPVMGVVVQSPVQKAAVSEYYILVVRACVRACVLAPDCGHGLLFNTYIYVYTVHSLSTQSPSMIIHPCTLNRLGAADSTVLKVQALFWPSLTSSVQHTQCNTCLTVMCCDVTRHHW